MGGTLPLMARAACSRRASLLSCLQEQAAPFFYNLSIHLQTPFRPCQLYPRVVAALPAYARLRS